jgi:CheY-like chemotaxis protein
MAKILVADDEPEVRNAVVGILTNAGHETQEAYDGLCVLDTLREYKPDLLLLDWMIPELFGGEVLAILRTDPEYKEFRDLPVIVVSDFDDETSMSKFKGAGATDFVAKRDNPEDMKDLLLERVNAALGK